MTIESPNCTLVPNILFDYWMLRLNPEEFVIVMILCRHHRTKITCRYLEDFFLKGPSQIEKIILPLQKKGVIKFEEENISLTEKFYKGGAHE